MRQKLLVPLFAVVLLLTLTQFQNCSPEKLPDELKTQGSLGLSARVEPSSVQGGGQAQVLVTGGNAPYTFQITSGSANVDNYGVVQVATSSGPVVIRVVDAKSAVANVTLSVLAGASSCRTSWGQTVSNGGTVTGYASSTAKCPQTCQSITLTCNNGTLSGGTATAGTCSEVSCLYIKTGTSNTDSTCRLRIGENIPVPGSCTAADLGKKVCYYPTSSYIADVYTCSSPP